MRDALWDNTKMSFFSSQHIRHAQKHKMRPSYYRIAYVLCASLSLCVPCVLTGCSNPIQKQSAADQQGNRNEIQVQEKVPSKKAGTKAGYQACARMYVVLFSINATINNFDTHASPEATQKELEDLDADIKNALYNNGTEVQASPLFGAAASDSAYEQDYEKMLSAAPLIKQKFDALSAAVAAHQQFVDPTDGEVDKILSDAFPTRSSELDNYPPANHPFDLGLYFDSSGTEARLDLGNKLVALGLPYPDDVKVLPGAAIYFAYHSDAPEVRDQIAPSASSPDYIKEIVKFFGLTPVGSLDKSGSSYTQRVTSHDQSGYVLYSDEAHKEDLVIVIGEGIDLL